MLARSGVWSTPRMTMDEYPPGASLVRCLHEQVGRSLIHLVAAGLVICISYFNYIPYAHLLSRRPETTHLTHEL